MTLVLRRVSPRPARMTLFVRRRGRQPNDDFTYLHDTLHSCIVMKWASKASFRNFG